MKSNLSDLANPNYNGYLLISRKHISEVNAECFLFEHLKSGARVLKIQNDDPNKTFGIAFKTLPVSDAGTPHILEHSVLNGSKNFPVKSPFDVLLKGSLSTFLNAMTYPDFTIYPVASVNHKDYFNLMHVYLDAVFNPQLYTDPRIFMQEGWHHELVSADRAVEYKGVVYNEMKGAFSNPERELWYLIQKHLFKDNGYRYSSGGYPSAITTLTYDDFVLFHRKHYHPSNSYIFFYGDADTGRELAFIDREYLSEYDKIRNDFDTRLNPPFAAVKELNAFYSATDGAHTEQQTYLALNWVIGLGSDPVTEMYLDLLADVLVNQESGPVRKALQEAGIGKDSYATVQNMQQNMFSIVVQNARAADHAKFRPLIMKTLEKVFKKGINRESLQGSLNRMEFRLREGDDAQKGLTCFLRSMNCWMFANDPFLPLEYESSLEQIKLSLRGTHLEDMIKKDLIDNPHSLLVKMEPKPGLERENNEQIRAALAEFKSRLTPGEMDSLVKSTRDLVAYQKKEDSPEALASIPVLQLGDITPEASWYEIDENTDKGFRQIYHEEFTNHIAYMNFWFDLRVLAPDLVPYAAVLSELLGKVDTGNYSFERLDQELNINTGGFNAGLNAFLPDCLDDMMLPQLRIQMKSTTDKLSPSMGLLAEILNGSRFDNRERLGELLRRLQSQLESSVKQNGLGVALTRLESYLSGRGVFHEMARGMEYYWFVTGLVKRYDADPDSIITRFTQIRDLLFTQGNIIAATTCGEDDFRSYSLEVPALISSLQNNPKVNTPWLLVPTIKNEGIETVSKVQYVVQGYDYRKLGLTWDGKWNVLSHILSTDWLQTRIRVIGGAYGGFAGMNRTGTIYLASYRDPNLKETLDNFRDTVEYLTHFKADSATMSRYIIGTVAHLDHLLTPSEKGELAFRRFMENTKKEEVQNERNSVLSTTKDDIRQMAGVIAKILDPHVVCVYGNEEKLKAAGDLFGSLVMLQR